MLFWDTVQEYQDRTQSGFGILVTVSGSKWALSANLLTLNSSKTEFLIIRVAGNVFAYVESETSAGISYYSQQ